MSLTLRHHDSNRNRLYAEPLVRLTSIGRLFYVPTSGEAMGRPQGAAGLIIPTCRYFNVPVSAKAGAICAPSSKVEHPFSVALRDGTIADSISDERCSFIPAEGIVPGHRLGKPGSGPNRACHAEAHTDTSDAEFQNDGLLAGFLPARSYLRLIMARCARRLLDSAPLTAMQQSSPSND